MNKLSLLDDLMEGHEVLSGVTYLIDPEPPIVEGISLQFSKTLLYISVDGRDDTLLITAEIPLRLKQLEKVVDPEVWMQAYNRSISWFWLMKNNQGYLDGVQFEFESFNDDEVCIQLIAIASALDIKLVKTISY